MKRVLPLLLPALLALGLASCGGGDSTEPDTCADLPAPALSGPASGEAGCGPGVLVAWDAVAGATHYSAELHAVAGCALLPSQAQEVAAPAAQATWANLTDGSTWYWRVRAENRSCTPREYSPWSECRRFTVENAAVPEPSMPGSLSPCGGNVPPGPVVFSWLPSSDATVYRGRVCFTVCEPVYWNQSFTVDAPATSTTILPAPGLGGYVWTVWAENRACWPYKSSRVPAYCSFRVEP